MAFIVTGTATCNRGCGRQWPRDPVLEVACPTCRAPVGVRCRRPSGHSGPFVELHADRDLLADAHGKYGPCPLGLCGLNGAKPQLALPLFGATAPETASTIATAQPDHPPRTEGGVGEGSG